MITEEARMVWLLKMGSGWVGLKDLYAADEETRMIYKQILSLSNFDYDPHNQTIKIKCKS